MIHVTNRPHIQVRLGALKLALGHFFAPLSVSPLCHGGYRYLRLKHLTPKSAKKTTNSVSIK
jgi:hypothetical protein